MKTFEAQRIKSVLKQLLKRKGLTYEDLADELDCSVPTVTRFLGNEELTLSRLLQLCEILEVDLADIQTLMSQEKEPEERFTPEQDAFLAKNRHFLAYLMRLFADDTPKQIAEKYKLSQRSTDRYLLGLEKQNLIRVTGKQKVKPAFKSTPTFGRGPLGNSFYELFLKNSCDFFVSRVSDAFVQTPGADSEPGSHVSVQVTKVSKESYKAWIEEWRKLESSFLKLASFEEKTRPASELMTAVVMNGRTLVENDYAGLHTLENTFGDIPNI